MELYKHNQETYEKALHMLQTYGKCAITQAPSTGKTFITMKLLETLFAGMRVLYCVPTASIIQGIQLYEDWDFDNVEFCLYRNLSKYTGKVDVLILDEDHRVGAPTYYTAVERFVGSVKYLLALSATPVRYLDGRRNMAIELCGECVVEGMNMSEAIESGVLAGFDYVAILSDVEKYVDIAEKKGLKRKLIGLDLSGYDITQRIRKYVTNVKGKWIIFYPNSNDLEQADTDIQNWLGEVPIYSFYSKQSKTVSRQSLELFNKEKGRAVIKTIDMLNEGVHLDGTINLIFARRTVSGNVFIQQLGRALHTGDRSKRALVIDLVENYNNIKTLQSYIPKCKTISAKAMLAKKETVGVTDVYISYDDILLELDKVLAKVDTKWSEWEDTVIREFYPIEGGNVYIRLEDKTASDCKKRAKALGVVRNQQWSREEDTLISQYYNTCRESLYKILRTRTPGAIDTRARKLGVVVKWTDEEDLILMRNWSKMGLAVVNLLPRRDVVEIQKRVRRLGL